MRLTMFKLPRYNKFNYQPLYWEPQKEEREKREARIKRELGITEDADGSAYVPNIKGQFSSKMARAHPAAAKQKRAANIRLAIILVFLFAGAYFLLFG